MRTVVAASDELVTSWLRGVLTSAGLSVALLTEPSADAPELLGGDLLIADRESAAAIGAAGPGRRLLLVPRGAVVDVSEALASGFLDLIVIPSPEDEVLGRVGRALDSFLKPIRATAEQPRAGAAELKAIAGRVCSALQKVGPEGRRMAHELAHGMLSVFLLLIDAHEATDRSAPGHSKRAAGLVRAMAVRLRMPEPEAAWLELAARMQDIGLLALHLPLGGSAPLSQELRRSLVDHPRLGAEILAPLQALGLPVSAVQAHHERVDGSGYPDGLSGDSIPAKAQILGAADAFHALTASRPWRAAETPAGALAAMRTTGGFAVDILELLEAAIADAVIRPATPVLDGVASGA